jgi:futalosine hydrolase
MILLACAVEAEMRFWKPRADIEALATGVGPVEAAAAVATALASRRYDLVVSAGIAGVFGDAAQVGDGVVVATDTMSIDLESGEAIPLPNGERTVEEAHSEPALVASLQAAGFQALRGVTVARVTCTDATAAALAASGAQVETMEGFAVLRAAARAGVPAVEIRGISNRCGDRARSGWDFAAGLSGLAKIAAVFFERCAATTQS